MRVRPSPVLPSSWLTGLFLVVATTSLAVAPSLVIRHVDMSVVHPGEPFFSEEPLATFEGSFPLLIEYFTTPHEFEWEQGTIPLAELEPLLSVTQETPDATEGDRTFASVSPNGASIPGGAVLWIRVSNDEGEAWLDEPILIEEREPQDPWTPPVNPLPDPPAKPDATRFPRFAAWRLEPAYRQGTVLVWGPTMPSLEINAGVAVEIEFFAGESGHTSRSLGKADLRGGTAGLYYAYFPGTTLNQTMKVWARVSSSLGDLDTPAAEFVVLPADFPFQIRYWPQKITHVEIGTRVALLPRFDVPLSVLDLDFYWGTAGDTSNPIDLDHTSGPLLLDIPADPALLWMRASNGVSHLDSPTTEVVPLPPSLPVLVDQPDDGFVDVATGSLPARFAATGGALTHTWYAGSPGDTAQVLTFFDYGSPDRTGNAPTRSHLITIPDGVEQVWLRVANAAGHADSRAVRAISPSVEDLAILAHDRRFRITPRMVAREHHFDIHIPGPRFFTTVPGEEAELLRWENGQWASLARMQEFGRADRFRLPHSHTYINLPSGTYRIRIHLGESFVETGDIEVVNEALDGNVSAEAPFAQLLVPARPETEGGLYEASVWLPVDYEPSRLEVFAGALGDRSEPVASTHDLPRRALHMPAGVDANESLVRVQWEPSAAGAYWLSVERRSGPAVMLVLKYADDHALDDGILRGEQPLEIVVPPGMPSLPLPRLPNPPDWILGDGGNLGLPISLPMEVEALSAALTPLWSAVEPVPGGPSSNVRVVIRVDSAAPPHLSRTPRNFLVDEWGRAVWAGRVAGEIEESRLLAGPQGGPLTEVDRYPLAVQRGFPVPPEADQARVEWIAAGQARAFEAPIVRLPAGFWDALGGEAFHEDSLRTLRLGAFLSVAEFPWLFQSELGWWWIHLAPGGNGFFFFARTTGNDYQWHWTTSALFPFHYNFATGSWQYYLLNSRGWFYDFATARWLRGNH